MLFASMPFSARALKKKVSLTLIYCGNKQIVCGLVLSVLVSTTTRVIADLGHEARVFDFLS